MRLRTQILIVLLLFGMAPLLVAVASTVPFIFEKLEGFYHRAHLLNLRADFRDLDQHLASRHETVRLLAKLATTRNLVNAGKGAEPAVVGADGHWLGSILRDQVDIISVMFLDRLGEPVASFERDFFTRELERRDSLAMQPLEKQVSTALTLGPGGVVTGPVRINPEADIGLPSRYLILQLVSPVFDGRSPAPGDAVGAVMVSLDIGGLARAYRNTYWAQADGRYIGREGSALEDFPGLHEIFSEGELSLWKGRRGEQIIWVPLLATERDGPLWAGREVDPSPIFRIMSELRWRIGVVVLLLIAMVLVIAHWLAGRMELFRERLTEGLGQILAQEQGVVFDWKGPREVRELADKLNRLSEGHVQNISALRQHARELESLNTHKSEFLANVSHELRTPLNSILLLSKLLANADDGEFSAAHRKQAKVINSAGTDLRNLIDDILDLSRIEARQTVLQLGDVDLPGLLEELIELVHAQAQQKGLALSLKVEEGVPHRIVSDTEMIRRIIKNFIANAIKFTHSGGVELILAANDDDDRHQRPVRIGVRDTGIGIPAHKHAVIFEAFKQADGSTSRRYGGTGLGLTISNELAGLLGGRIALESAAGQGAEFSLVLPLDFEPGEEIQVERVVTADNGPEAEPPVRADFSGRRVLLADHEVQTLLALTPVLESWNVDVTAAGSEEELLEELDESTAFDLMIINPRVLDGGRGRLRALLGEGLLPAGLGVLVVGDASGDALEGERGRLMEFTGHPVDPVRLEQLLRGCWE
ncbi:MAG: ATP-binding protein [Gammaproteobacteria bacterium]|nr:ATP-binding protein [Gammaproteobacteria bacterium]